MQKVPTVHEKEKQQTKLYKQKNTWNKKKRDKRELTNCSNCILDGNKTDFLFNILSFPQIGYLTITLLLPV